MKIPLLDRGNGSYISDMITKVFVGVKISHDLYLPSSKMVDSTFEKVRHGGKEYIGTYVSSHVTFQALRDHAEALHQFMSMNIETFRPKMHPTVVFPELFLG